jgi:hypothetical protein
MNIYQFTVYTDRLVLLPPSAFLFYIICYKQGSVCQREVDGFDPPLEVFDPTECHVESFEGRVWTPSGQVTRYSLRNVGLLLFSSFSCSENLI